MNELIRLLHDKNCSCVIQCRDGSIQFGHQRGVADLYGIVDSGSGILDGAAVADKVVGKGAAALMILGKINRLHADVISKPALLLLEKAGIAVSYGTLVDNIINRAGTGICPVEQLTRDAATAEEAFPLIASFVKKLNDKQHITN